MFLLAGLFLVELAVLAIAYQFFASIECQQTGWSAGCTLLRSLMGRAIVVLAASGLIAVAWPDALRRFLAEVAAAPRRTWPALLHFVGLVLMFIPILRGWGPELGAHFASALPYWLAGAALAMVGGLAWVAPGSAWHHLIAHNRYSVALVLVLAAILPDLAETVRPLWDWTALSSITFAAVEHLLNLISDEVYSDPALYQIGINSALGGIVVRIGQPCSGVEGFALITAFVALYGYLFRADLRFPRYWLVVLPLGLLASWILNVLRITALVWIGARVSPDLAVNGFHSYAGWFLFTLLTLAVIAVVQATPWLHRTNAIARPGLPMRRDPVAAQILPFIAMMLAGILTSTFLIEPALGYPLVAFVLIAALWFVWPALRQLPLSPDPLSLALGGVVGAAWVIFAPPATGTLNDSLATLGSLGFALWVAFRLLGTAVLVPVVEELFFRGYLLSRLDGPAPWRRWLALGITSATFALLHGRWFAAAAAGLVFGLLALRRGRVTDAIQAHMTANALIALVALARSDWTLI
ncbi:exosortase E/protease, VPEID-CTERM system [Neotabrizicola shimadae]|uniref:exosortase E/protease, VPEID-CTERM system n=1 Tax=Neotabrizicola shimadae TaxID=2807096 RepID=UPI001C7CDA90|nr:exosortase E/protease, VPEID-CTERM system [Neotabrizicola shimadae]